MRTNIAIQKELHERLIAEAFRRKIKIYLLVEEFIEDGLKKRRKK